MSAAADPSPVPKSNDAGLYAAALAVSAVALAPLVYVLLLRDRSHEDTGRLAFMPAVNASLNGIAAACQICGWFAIRARRRELHKRLMLSAVTASALFFVGYLVYHYVHGDTRYPGSGPIRTAYLVLLASHVLMSIVLVPTLLVVLYRAWKASFDRHKRLAKVVLPIWLYVSVTGIIVFWMLKTA